MRIVVDLQGAQSCSRFRGIGRYVNSLIKEIIKKRDNDEIIIVLSSLFYETIEPIKETLAQYLPEKNILVFSGLPDVSYSDGQFQQNREISEYIREYFIHCLQPDMLLITSLFEGMFDDSVISIDKIGKYYPTSIIFYDLIPHIMPELYLNSQPNYKAYYYDKFKYLKNVDLFLCISESSKNEVLKYIVDAPHRAVNISAAIEDSFCTFSMSDTEKIELKKKFDIKNNYVFYAPGGFDLRKNFENLIDAFSKLPPELLNSYQLVIASKIDNEMERKLRDIVNRKNITQDRLILTGYVSDEDLKKLYQAAELFIFPSLHEGFGLPVLEAMACGAPVIASNRTSIPEIVGLKEAMFDPENVDDIKEKIVKALTDNDYRQKLLNNSKEQSKKFSWERSAEVALKAIRSFENKYKYKSISLKEFLNMFKDKTSITSLDEKSIVTISEVIDNNLRELSQFRKDISFQIEGPFDSSYSLAILNRNTALALDRLGYDVSLYSTEGPGDFEPNPDFLSSNPKIKALYEKSKSDRQFLVQTRNLYPPRVNDMDAQVCMLHHYAWEESNFPPKWVDDFNKYLDGITCLSNHVKKILIDSGVNLPMFTTSCGADHILNVEVEDFRLDAKKFKFLHISSCFPRKGVELLLQAYSKVFNSQDDVSLIIKTFKNPHNNIEELLANLKNENKDFPDVKIIYEDLTDGQIKSLYCQCDAFVAPSFAEGFGLPIAEAMLLGVPVITTNWGGQLDFCDETNSILLDYDYAKADTHFNLFDSVWARPKLDSLVNALKKLYNMAKDEREIIIKKAKDAILSSFTWEKTAKRLVSAVKNIDGFINDKDIKIAWISTFNTRCGIASYSKYFIDYLSQEDITIFAPLLNLDESLINENDNCIRVWEKGKERNNLDNIYSKIQELNINSVIIQFNFSFFNHFELADFIIKLKDSGKVVVVVLHSTTEPFPDIKNYSISSLKNAFIMCDRLLVHSINDLNNLKQLGHTHNVTLFPQGVIDIEPITNPQSPIPNPRSLASRAPISNPKSKIHNPQFFAKQNKIPNPRASEPTSSQSEDCFTMSTFGFCLPHKGLLEIIDAFNIIYSKNKKFRLNMYNAIYPIIDSIEFAKKINEKIDSLNLRSAIGFKREYIPDAEVINMLAASDLIVFPYQQTGESSSAAVRFGLASRAPVAVTPAKIFDDLQNSVFRLQGFTPEEMADSIIEVVDMVENRDDKYQQIMSEADRWLGEHRYSALSKRLINMIKSIMVNNNA